MSTAVPEILWAQRSSASEPEKNVIMLTINVPNMKPEATKCELTTNALHFESTIEADASKGIVGNKYVFDLDFFEEVVPAESKQHLTAKSLYLLIRKEKAQEEYWPRLTKEKVRLHNVKTDFDKWVDEDEQAEKPDDMGMGGFDPSMLSAMGGGAGGMGGMDLESMMSQMGGGADAPDFDDEDDEGEDAEAAEGEAKA
ncbi:p23 chaperone protein wos2 [Malassezia nana]|uniref:P23 chaperone protein wos2 n=1 Tax=Malassezia nana TaxID=180528 RepID=A0AAF0J378_9BASI|nr:p23 chaperone protein wos2 [Malassezia nana]